MAAIHLWPQSELEVAEVQCLALPGSYPLCTTGTHLIIFIPNLFYCSTLLLATWIHDIEIQHGDMFDRFIVVFTRRVLHAPTACCFFFVIPSFCWASRRYTIIILEIVNCRAS